MGGDRLFAKPREDTRARGCGTITLGGVETTTGVRGFIGSGHVISRYIEQEDGRVLKDYSFDDITIVHSRDSRSNLVRHLLGKVFKMPSFYQEGDRRIITTDAALVAYPYPTTPGCSLTWSGGDESFCLEDNGEEQIERLVPLTIRGTNGATHKVVGSQAVTEGLRILASGVMTGPIETIAKERQALILGVDTDVDGLFYEYVNYSEYADDYEGLRSVPGNSGAPVYTTPDEHGNVRMVGVLSGGGTDPAGNKIGIFFSPWNQVSDEFNLKPAW